MEYSIELYKDINSQIKLSVALPVYNSKKICWLALESLCNQKDINFDWELIIYEEIHDQSAFPQVLENYEELLIKAGCKRIVLIINNKKVSLVEKWIEIGKNISESSKIYMLHAADCYSPKKRLKTTYDKIVGENYDWYDQTLGYFYSFISDKVILYNYIGLTNLNMSFKSEFIKSLPYSDLKKGIDGYLHRHCEIICEKQGKKLRHYYDKNLYKDSVDTHGFNNISLDREKYFKSKPNIFKIQTIQLEDLQLNETTLKKIRDLGGTEPKKQTKNFDLSIIISTYKNVKYLKDCFDSITNSINNQNVEVLVGIDSCSETYNFIRNEKFPSNFKFYFFEENNGPYLVFNTLSKISKSDNIMFFGSDDIMDKNMVIETINALNNHSCFKPRYVDFKDGEKINLNSKHFIGEGVFGVKKSIFEQMNGFEPWMCAADSDFMGRFYKKKYKLKVSNKLNFYRRIHNQGLTSRKDTGMRSSLRAQYAKISKNKSGDGNPDKLNVRDYIEVMPGQIINIKPPKPPKPKNSVLNILSKTPEPPQTKQNKEINYEEVNKVIYNKQTNKPKTNQGLNNQSVKTLNIKKKLFENLKGGGIHRESRRI